MWIQHALLTNVGPFAELDLEFKRGSIGIFGPNGCGKTTVLNSIYGAITDDFGRFAGLKADCSRAGSDEKAESSVFLEMEHNGIDITLIRGFRPVKHEIRIGKNKPVTGKNPVQIELERALGVNGRFLDHFVFKDQGAIFDFLVTTPVERAKAYQILNQTQVCQEIYEILGDYLNRDTEARAEIYDNSDELAEQISSLKTRIGKLQDERIGQAKKMLSDRALKRADFLKRKQEKHNDLLAQLRAAKDDMVLAKAERHEVYRQWKEQRDALEATKAAAAMAEDRAKPYRERLTLLQRHLEDRKRRLKLEREAQELAEQEARHGTPEEMTAENIEELEKWRRDALLLDNGYNQAREAMDSLRKASDKCPTCGTKGVDLSKRKAELNVVIKAYPAKYAELRKLIEELHDMQQAWNAHKNWLVAFEASKKANAKALAALPKDNGLPDNREELQERIDSATEMQEAATRATQVEAQLKAQHAAAKARHEDRQKRVEALTNSAGKSKVDRLLVARAAKALQRHEDAKFQCAGLDGTLRGLHEQFTMVDGEMKSLRARLKRSKQIHKMVRLVERAREVCHASGLPQRVAQANLLRMVGDINKGLELFNRPFWIDIGANSLSMMAHFPGEPARMAERCSWGEKVILAIAFWQALHSLYRSEIGLLALDEPTANLDADNRRYFADALPQLTKRVRGNRQLIMTTHAEELRGGFDQVIDLPGKTPI